MNPWALTACVTGAVLLLSVFVALAAHLVGAVLGAPQRAILVAVSYAAGFCTAVGAFYLRS